MTTTIEKIEKKKENKFEFALFINDYKIIGRYFSADDYNPQIRNSVDIKHLVDEIVEMIRADLKQKDVEYIWEHKRGENKGSGYDLREKSAKARIKN